MHSTERILNTTTVNMSLLQYKTQRSERSKWTFLSNVVWLAEHVPQSVVWPHLLRQPRKCFSRGLIDVSESGRLNEWRRECSIHKVNKQKPWQKISPPGPFASERLYLVISSGLAGVWESELLEIRRRHVTGDGQEILYPRLWPRHTLCKCP